MTTVSTHAPGDRVRIQHDPKLDREYRADEAPNRAALNGLVGIIRERASAAGMCFRVAVPESRTVPAWFEPSELAPIVTDPDGLEVGAPAAPPASALPSPQDALASLAAVVAERDALRARLEAASAAWASCRAWLLSLPRPLGTAGLAAVDAVDAALGGPAAKTKIAGPWQDGRDGLRWRPRGDDPTRSAATVGPSGWTSFASPPAGGPEAGGEGESRADRALLAAGWTLEGAPAPVDDAQVLRAACEAVTGTVGLPAGELAARVLAGVQRVEASAADYVNSRARDLGTSSG